MITFILGTPGSGKSFEAVKEHIVPSLHKKANVETGIESLFNKLITKLKKGKKAKDTSRYIITNLPLNLEHLDAQGYDTEYIKIVDMERRGDEMVHPFSKVEDFEKWEKCKTPNGHLGPLFVIDECHMSLDVRSKLIDIEHWFSMHRHHGSDIVLISQSYGKVNKNIREMSELVKQCRKLRFAGLNTRYQVFYKTGFGKDDMNTQKIKKYEKKYFPYYQSYTKGGDGEADSTDQPAFWKSWKFLMFFSIICYSFYSSFSYWVIDDNKMFSTTEVSNTDLNISKTDSIEFTQSEKPEPELVPSSVPVPAPVPVSVCDPFSLSDLDFVYSHRVGSEYYFKLVRDGRYIFKSYSIKQDNKLSFNVETLTEYSYMTSSQLRHMGYNIKNVYLQDVYENYDFWRSGKLYHDGVTGNFVGTFTHKNCDSFSKTVTDVDPQAPVLKEEEEKNSAFSMNLLGTGADKTREIFTK